MRTHWLGTITTIAALCASSQWGCATRTPVYSKPRGATVVMDGARVIGTTPIVIKEYPWLFQKHELVFSKQGYYDETVVMAPSGNPVNYGICLAGSCVSWMFWPIAMLGRYPEEIVVELRPDGSHPPKPPPMSA